MKTDRRRRVLISTLVVLSACADASDGTRTSDGVLESILLQAVVDAGIDRDVEAMRGFLAHRDAAVRARAAFQLASMPGAVAKSELLALLRDASPIVRADAAFALGRFADTLGTADMATRLRDETDPGVRLRLIEALGTTGGRGAAALLLRTEIHPSEQAQLAIALARQGHRGVNNAVAVERLYELTGSEDATTRRNAAYYFGRSNNAAFWSPVATRLRERLDGLAKSDEAAPWLILALGRLGDPSDTDRLVAWLAAGVDWRSRYAAAQALVPRMQSSEVNTVLFAALADPSPHVRTSAAHALAQARSWSEQEIEFVRAWIAEHPEDWRAGGVLLGGLARLAPEGEADVRAWLERHPDDTHVRASGIRALDRLDGDWAMTELFAAAATDGPSAAAALETLALRWPSDASEMANEYYDVLSAAARSGDLMKVNLAAGMLTDPAFLDLGAGNLLIEAFNAMDDAGVAPSATTVLSALGTIGIEAAETTLRAALEHESASVRLAAADALDGLIDGPIPDVSATDAPDRTIDWSALAALGPRPRLLMDTDVGQVTVELDAEQAPLTVQSFVQLAEAGAFDGSPFHRVVPFFVVQGGDTDRGDGYGISGFRLRTEATRTPFVRGTLGMASSGPDTEGSQFFLNHVIAPHLDGSYTAFGKVVAGQDVVDKIERWHEVRTLRLETGS